MTSLYARYKTKNQYRIAYDLHALRYALNFLQWKSLPRLNFQIRRISIKSELPVITLFIYLFIVVYLWLSSFVSTVAAVLGTDIKYQLYSSKMYPVESSIFRVSRVHRDSHFSSGVYKHYKFQYRYIEQIY